MRLLPWTGEGGKPAYLSADDGSGYVSRLADGLEAVQLGMAGDLVERVRRITVEEQPSEVELRSVVGYLLEALGDVVRVAQSRGDRLPVRDDGDLAAIDGGGEMAPGTSAALAGECPAVVEKLWPSVACSVGGARGFVAAHLDAWGLSQLADSAVLVVSELVTNAVVHAQSPYETLIATRLERLECGVRIEVHDRSGSKPERRDASADDESGRGLALVDALTGGHWGVSDRDGPGKMLWAVCADDGAAGVLR